MTNMDVTDAGISSISAPMPAELANLPTAQLQELLECDELLEEFVLGLPHMKLLSEECDKLVQGNVSLAKSNQALNTEYESVRDKTLHCAETLSTLQQSFEKLSVESQEVGVKLQPCAIQEIISVASAQLEEQSETLAESFLDNKIDVETFLKQYIEKRIVSHTRKLKSERLKSQLYELQKSGF